MRPQSAGRPQSLAAPEAAGQPDSYAFEQLLSGIASRFIDLPLGRFDDVVVDALQRVVLALDLDRSTISEAHEYASELRVVHSWVRPGVALPLVSGPTSITFPWVASRMRQGRPVVFSRLSDLPPEAAADAESYAKLGLRAHVSMPIHVAGRFVSVLSFGVLRAEREWPEALLARMRLLADIFGSFLARKLAEDRIDEQLRFERLLADISTSLAAVVGERAEPELQRAMEAAGTFLRVDRLRVYRADADATRLALAREWHAPGARGGAGTGVDDEQQMLREVLAGRVVRSNGDRTSGRWNLLAIPLLARGAVAGALSMERSGEAPAWPDELLPRIGVFGNMLAGAIARRDAEEGARRAMLEASEHRERLAHVARVDAVGAMSAAIAHEINQPLTAIRNYALAAQRRLAGEGRIDRVRLVALVEKIAGQAEAASEVLDRIRAMVKPREPREVRIDMAALFASALRLIEIEARRQDVRVYKRVQAGLPAALGDEIQVQQVLMNLAHNAIEAMSAVPSGRRALHLSAAAGGGGRILVEVSDTGPGVAPAEAAHIFEPFYTTRATGLGIGLSICRAIVEAHGGELWHEPRSAGGSSFRFTLPAAKEGV